MTLEEELQLSWYQEVARIDEDRDIWLVQDVRDRKFYVKKRLTVYHAQIYRHLRQRPVAHTPRIYAAVEEDGVLTVIEEYIPGDTLRELLDREGPFPTERAIDIAAALCRILEEFHSRNGFSKLHTKIFVDYLTYDIESAGRCVAVKHNRLSNRHDKQIADNIYEWITHNWLIVGEHIFKDT